MNKYIIPGTVVIAYGAFVVSSYIFGSPGGPQALSHLFDFAKELLLLLPFAFILIGLFEAWVKKETIEKYLGLNTGFSAYIIAILLAGTTIGGLYIAFPFAYALHKKGAKLAVVFTYLSCAGICRIPMTIFEATFLGLKFTIVRFAVSLPLVLLASWLMGTFLQARNYTLSEPSVPPKAGV